MSALCGTSSCARPAAAAEHEGVHGAQAGGLRGALGVGDDPPHLAELRLALGVAVRDAAAPPRLPSGSARSRAPARSGREPISTPTCSPWRTPIEIRPRTTLSIRSLTSCAVWARSSNRNRVSSGARRIRSSTSRPSEIRVPGWTCSRRVSRGSAPAASRASTPTPWVVRRAAPTTDRAIPPLDGAGELQAVADAIDRVGLRRRASASGSSGTSVRPSGSSPSPVAPPCPGRDRRPGDRVRDRARRPARSGRRAAPARRRRREARRAGSPGRPARGRSRRRCRPPTGSESRCRPASAAARRPTKPPSSRRLCEMNWPRNSDSAGPGQATQPSASRNRRWPSRASSRSRSCSCSRNSIRPRADLIGSSS